MKSMAYFKDILTVLTALSIRLNKQDVKKIFGLEEKEYADFYQYAEAISALKQGNDGKMDFFFNEKSTELTKGPSLDMYVDAICYMIKVEKLDWTLLEIDRLRKEFSKRYMFPDDVLIITNRIGENFEKYNFFQKAADIYLTGSKYCDKNNIEKDVFVDCVLHLSKVCFMRGITSVEIVKLQERATALVSERNSTYNDALLMLYTGINQTNTYRDTDGFVLRQKGARLLDSFDDVNREDDSMIVKAWHYSLSGEVEKIISLYEDTILSIEKNKVEKASPFLYLPIIFAYFYLGEYSKALVLAEVLYKDAVKKADAQAGAMMLSLMGRCYVYMNHLEQAESVLYDALGIAKQINYSWATYYTLIALSFLHYKRGNAKGCIEVLEMSDKLSKEEALGNIQNSPFILDVFKLIDESGEKTTLPGYNDKVNASLQSKSYLMLGVALRHDADRKAEIGDKAEDVIRTYQDSIEMLRRTGCIIEIGRTQAMLSKYFVKINYMEAAEKYAQRAYANLLTKSPEFLPLEVLRLVNSEFHPIDINIKINTLALELNHITDKDKMITRMITSLERLLHCECGALITYQGENPEIAFQENIYTDVGDDEKEKKLLAICSFINETKKIHTKCNTTDVKYTARESELPSLERQICFFVGIPLCEEDMCKGVIYIGSYLRKNNLTHEESQALFQFAERIAPHFFAIMEYSRNDYLMVEKVQNAFEKMSLGYCKSSNASIIEVEKMIKRVAQTDVPILIYGETGVGKEYFAKETYANSNHKNIFIKVNCGAIPESLIESELFGYEKGSFTGASQRKIGYFEAAEGGTVFLDEIGELSMYAQTKLLRVLQEKTLMRVGGTSEIKVNFRLVAATNKDLEKEVEKGNFRQDLYYRLNLIQLRIPPLRERKEDIISFAKFFVQKFEQQLGESGHYLSEDTLLWMLEYGWPGNIRELENVMHRAVLLADGEEIRIDPIKKKKGAVLGAAKIDTLEEMERKYILQVLDLCNGKISGPGGAAELLGIKRTTLTSKMEKLGIVKKTN